MYSWVVCLRSGDLHFNLILIHVSWLGVCQWECDGNQHIVLVSSSVVGPLTTFPMRVEAGGEGCLDFRIREYRTFNSHRTHDRSVRRKVYSRSDSDFLLGRQHCSAQQFSHASCGQNHLQGKRQKPVCSRHCTENSSLLSYDRFPKSSKQLTCRSSQSDEASIGDDVLQPNCDETLDCQESSDSAEQSKEPTLCDGSDGEQKDSQVSALRLECLLGMISYIKSYISVNTDNRYLHQPSPDDWESSFQVCCLADSTACGLIPLWHLLKAGIEILLSVCASLFE